MSIRKLTFLDGFYSANQTIWKYFNKLWLAKKAGPSKQPLCFGHVNMLYCCLSGNALFGNSFIFSWYTWPGKAWFVKRFINVYLSKTSCLSLTAVFIKENLSWTWKNSNLNDANFFSSVLGGWGETNLKEFQIWYSCFISK